MGISAELVKELRDKTGVSIIECKKALEATDGNVEKALVFLGTRAADVVTKKSDRALGAGTVASYIHNKGQVGVLVLLLCETDFVSKNEEFVALARDIAMHAAAMRPENKDVLLSQFFIKDEQKTIADLIANSVQKFGERIEIGELSIFSVR